MSSSREVCLGVGESIPVMISTNLLTEAVFQSGAFSDAFSLASASALLTIACSSIEAMKIRDLEDRVGP